MKELDPTNQSRRNAMKMLAIGSSAGLMGLFDSKTVMAETYETPSYQKGLAPVKIKSVRARVSRTTVRSLLKTHSHPKIWNGLNSFA